VGETAEDVQAWSEAGYNAVEMEASTVFAVSRHFKVPAAASVYIGDNLIESKTNLDDDYQNEADLREQNQKKQISAALALLGATGSKDLQ
jgi:purine-nucleoside phosphorylase